MPTVKLNGATADLLLQDLTADSDDLDYSGWLVETEQGVLYLPDNPQALPMVATSEDGHGAYHYVWSLTDEAMDATGWDHQRYLFEGARSTTRIRIVSRASYSHQII